MRSANAERRRSLAASILVLAIGQGLSGSVISLLTAISSLVGAMLAPSPALGTVPVTATVIGAAIMIYPISSLMQRLGRRQAFLAGSAIGIAGGAVAGLGLYLGSFVVFVIGTFILGPFVAFNQYYRFAAADVAVDKEQRVKAISYVTAGGIIGGFLGPFVASRSADLSPIPFVGTFAALIVVCCVLALVQFFFDDAAKPAAAASSGARRPIGEILTSAGFVTATLNCAAGFGVMTLLMNATPLAMKACGFTLAESASVIQWHFVAMYAPALVSGALMVRLGLQRFVLIGIAMNLAGIAVATYGIGYVNFWIALACFGVGWSFMFTGGTALLTATYSEAEKAQVQGMNSLIVYLANVLASFAAGYVLELSGWAGVNLLAVPVLVLAAAVTLWSMRPREQMVPTT
jgi:MFS family permease